MKTATLLLIVLAFPFLSKGSDLTKKVSCLLTPPAFTSMQEVNTQPKEESSIKLKIVGNLYVALENWSKVGDGKDAKIGYGLGGMVGIGLKIDDLVIGVGPHMGINRWDADYSSKTNSATSSVYYELMDTGIEGVFYMNMGKSKCAIIMGAGETEINGGYVVNGQTIMYPNTNKAKESYKNVGIGFYFGKVQISPTYVTYTGVAKAAERLEIRIGIAF
jgi:hypothetical protein